MDEDMNNDVHQGAMGPAAAPKEKVCGNFWRQFKTMFRKDLLVTIRHPILLFLELVVPALLFLTICDNRFEAGDLTNHYDAENRSIFDLSKKSIAYYPSNDPATV